MNTLLLVVGWVLTILVGLLGLSILWSIIVGRISLHGFALGLDPSPVRQFSLAVAMFLAATGLAFMQSPRPDALRPPRWFVSTAWWRYPLEWNAANRLPKIECSLRAIQAVPNSTSIWAVGNKGMVVNSPDSGKTWTKNGIETGQLRPAAAPSPAIPAKAFLAWPDLIPTASAAQDVSLPQAGTPTPTPVRRLVPRGRGAIPTPTPRRVASAFASQQGTPAPTPGASPSPSATPGPMPSETPLPEDEQLIAVYFYDGNRGEAASNWGIWYFTTNSGTNWTREFLFPGFPDRMPASLFPLRSLTSLRYASGGGRDYVAVSESGEVFVFRRGVFADYGGSNATSAYLLVNTTAGWIAGREGTVYRIRDGGSNWDKLLTQTLDDLHAVFFLDQSRGWVVGSNGAIFTTNDSGTTWTKQASGTTSQLNAVNFLSDGLHGWIAGNDGLILSTEDGGGNWVHRTQGLAANSGWYLRFPAPWYFFTLFLVGLFVWRRPKATDEYPEESVADVLVSDRPLEEATGDVLAFNSIARGLSRFLRNENTLPPLTIAITGEWGTGKSSLMNLLRADLRSYNFRPVWFNAWHHQKEEHMLASLLENIKLQAVPRWWTLRGILFRGRLLRIRGWRHWGPVAALVFFIYVMVIYQFGHQGTETNFSAFLKSLVTPFGGLPSTSGSDKSLITLVPLLAGIVTFLGAVWRGITAFGVKPASLLAGVSRGVSVRGLEAQTSFRQKFAVQFNDVTQALGKRSMLIFIDDLDRCRPENVLETLEAVNFLTTSGECFVIIGMAREYVERCVGRAFNEVAQEMVDDLQDESKESAEEIAKQKRIEFARQYLDKLVNIEVPVPAPKQSQSLALLVASTREAQLNGPTSRWQQFKLALVNRVEQRWRLVPALLVIGGLIVLGYILARGLAGTTTNTNSDSNVATTGPTPQPSVAPSPVAATVANPTPSTNPTPTPLPTPTPTPDTERSVLVSGARAFVSPGILPLLALLALIWLGSIILTRRSGLVVKDSPRFIAALQIWHPLVFARQRTPRATKRFMNFVRYLAMRQRRQRDNQPLIKQFLAKLKEKFTGVKTPEQVMAEVVNADSVVKIPDEVLVALAALQHLNPGCLIDQPGPASSPDEVWPRAISAASPLRPLFEKAREDHEAKFGNWATLSQYRDRFLEMTANVQVR